MYSTWVMTVGYSGRMTATNVRQNAFRRHDIPAGTCPSRVRPRRAGKHSMPHFRRPTDDDDLSTVFEPNWLKLAKLFASARVFTSRLGNCDP